MRWIEGIALALAALAALARHLGDHPVEAAYRDGFAPFRPARARAAVPGHDVEMDPACGGVDEIRQEESRRDGPGEGAVAGIVDVGDGAVDHPPIGLVERHAPERIVRRLAMLQRLLRDAVVIGEE